MDPQLVVAIADTADNDGNFDVGLLELDGSVIHTVRLNRYDVAKRMDLTLNYENPAVGPFEVRVAIRPAPPPAINSTPESADDYDCDEYR